MAAPPRRRRRPRQGRWWQPLAVAVAAVATAAAAAAGVATLAAAADETVVLPDGDVVVRSPVRTGTTLRLTLAGGGSGGGEPAPPPAGAWLVEAAFLHSLVPRPANGAAPYPPADGPSLALMAATAGAAGGGTPPPEPRVAVAGDEPLVAGAYGPGRRLCHPWEPCVEGASVADVAALLTRSPSSSVVVAVPPDGGVPTVVLTVLPGVSPKGDVRSGGSYPLRLRARRVEPPARAECVTPWAVGGVLPPGVAVSPAGGGDEEAIRAALPPPGPDVVCSAAGTCSAGGVCRCNGTRAGPHCGAPIVALGTNRALMELTMEPRTSRYFSVVVTDAETRASRSRLLVSLELLGGAVADAGCALRMAYRPPAEVQPPEPAPGLPPGVLPSRSLVPRLRDLYRIRSTVRLLTPGDDRADFPTGSTVLLAVDHKGTSDRGCPATSASAAAVVALQFEECAGDGCPQAVVGGLQRLVWTALIASSFLLAVSATAYLWHRFMSRGRASAPITRHDRLTPAEADRMLPVFPYSAPVAAEAVRTAAAAVAASEAAAAAAAAAASQGRVATAVAVGRRRLGLPPRVEAECADPEAPPPPPPQPPGMPLTEDGNEDTAAASAEADTAAAAAVAAAAHGGGGNSSSSSSDSDSSSSDSDTRPLSPPSRADAGGDAPLPPVAECSVCLAALEAGDPARALPCGHTFHADCITPWVTAANATCPTCRQGVRIGTLSDRPTLRSALAAAVARLLRERGGREGGGGLGGGRGAASWRRRARRRLRRRRRARHVSGGGGVGAELVGGGRGGERNVDATPSPPATVGADA